MVNLNPTLPSRQLLAPSVSAQESDSFFNEVSLELWFKFEIIAEVMSKSQIQLFKIHC